MKQASNEEFARAFAPLIEVMQQGKIRAATADDLLEVLEAPRYVLKGKDGRYIADGTGWTKSQREAIVIPERTHARELRELGRAQYGVETRVVRLRRRGTMGIEGLRLRAGLDAHTSGDVIRLSMTNPEAMQMLAALTGASIHEDEN